MKPSQIDIQTKSSFRKKKKKLKQATSKAARKLARKLLDDSPKKITQGWLS